MACLSIKKTGLYIGRKTLGKSPSLTVLTVMKGLSYMVLEAPPIPKLVTLIK